jgi:hypothetical protein
MGRAAGMVVLEALAIELVLKARLLRAGALSKQLAREHDHAALYAELPDTEKQESQQRYQSGRNPFTREKLADALAFSAKKFNEWRYMHEEPKGVEASLGEMQRAFVALADGM